MVSFLSAKKKGAVVGVDIGSHLTKVTRIQHKDKGELLLDFAQTLEHDRTDVKYEQALKEFLSKNKLLGSYAALSMEDSSFKIRKVELPKMPEADLREAVKWKMRDVVDGNIEEYVVRSSMIAASSDGKRQTLVGYAAKTKAVNQLLQLSEHLGLNAQWIEPTAINLAGAIEAVSNSDEEWIAGIDLGVSKSIMIILGNGKFYFSRPLTGISLNSQKELGESFNQKLAGEIQNSLDTFAVTFNVEQISRLYLAGGGALLPALDDYLSQNLGIVTQKIDPLKGLEVKQGLLDQIGERLPLFAQSISLSRIKL
jgi:MSHA biogenesis protein MshI